MKVPILSASVLLFSTIALQANADMVIDDYLIVQGKLCNGFDCVNGQVFGTETIRISANNARMTFIDVTADPDSQSWRLVANDRVDGGLDWFQFQVQPDLSGTDAGTAVAHFGVPGDDSIALGSESEIVNGAVSIGQKSLERRIMHVASALADTDLVTVADTKSSAYKIHDQLDAIDAQLDEIERTIRVAKGSKLVQSGGSGSGAFFVLLGSFVVLRRLRRHPDNGDLK